MLLLAPNLLLEAFGIEKTNEVWIRVDGVLMLAISIYYMITAKHEFTALIKATAYIRLTIIIFFTAFVSLKMVSPSILIIGIIDFIGAIWTILMLKKEGHFFASQ